MKILLVSDSHGDINVLKDLYQKYPKMDLYLHAGDSLLTPLDISPFISVKGNCDYGIDFLENIKIKTPYGYLYMQHKPYFPLDILNDDTIRIYIYGHTHIPEIRKVKDKYFLNPGSITYPRSSQGKTFMILDINENKIEAKILQI